jgi:hypothetical protein
LNGNPGRVPKPSRALATAGKAHLRLRDGEFKTGIRNN